MVYAVAKSRRFLPRAPRPAMFDPCYPASHVAASLTRRPILHALHHAMGRVVHHARPHGIAAAPAPMQPAASCARMPGALPAGPGAGASSAASGAGPVGQAAGSQAAGTGAVGGAFGGAKALAAAAVAAGLAVGGALMAADASGTATANGASAAITSTDTGTRLPNVMPTFTPTGLPAAVDVSRPRSEFLPPSSQTPGNLPETAPENITDVPEPASFALLGFGALAVIGFRHRFRHVDTRLVH